MGIGGSVGVGSGMGGAGGVGVGSGDGGGGTGRGSGVGMGSGPGGMGPGGCGVGSGVGGMGPGGCGGGTGVGGAGGSGYWGSNVDRSDMTVRYPRCPGCERPGGSRQRRSRLSVVIYARPPMAFGQQSGPPATAKQVQELLTLLQAAGHSDFRDARGPLGLTQRQGNGKFTRDEAQAFIDQLQEEADGDGEQPADAAPPVRLTAAEQALRRISTEHLAAELQRRGWIVIEP